MYPSSPIIFKTHHLFTFIVMDHILEKKNKHQFKKHSLKHSILLNTLIVQQMSQHITLIQRRPYALSHSNPPCLGPSKVTMMEHNHHSIPET